MKKGILVKISLVLVLLMLSIISISSGNKRINIISNWLSPKNGGINYDVPLYITGVGLNRDSFICIYEDGVTLDGSSMDPDNDCMVKITSNDMVEEGVLKSTFFSSEDTYQLTIFTQDDCNNAYKPEYTTFFTPGNNNPIFLSLEDYNVHSGGDNNHYCNNGVYNNEAYLYIYKYWQNEGNNYASQRPDRTYYKVGTYDPDTDTYTINNTFSTSISSSNSSVNFGKINTKYNYLFETNNNIDNYQCYLYGGEDGKIVTIDNVKYCVVKLNNFGYNSYYYANVYNRYIGADTQTITYDVKVNWDDDDNRDGLRPSANSSHIYLRTYGNGISYGDTYVRKSGNWEATLQLPIKDYKDNDVNYTFNIYNTPNGYTCTLEKDDENSEININCVHEPTKIDVHVTNEWRNLIDKSPDKVVVNLLKNGEIFKTVELTEEDNWEYTFEDLYKYEDGVAITYGIQQKAIEGYELQVLGAYIDGFQLINSQVNETRKVNITTEMVCGNGKVTGAEQLVYGSDSSAESIVATADEGYVIDYIKVNGEKIDIDENLTTYILEHFENLTEDKNIETCFKKIKKPKAQNIINPNTKRGFFTGTFILSLGALSYLIITGIKKKSIKSKKYDLGIATAAMIISLFSILNIRGEVETNTIHKKSVMEQDNVNYIYLTNYSMKNTELVIDGRNGYHDTITLAGLESENVASLGYVYKIPVEPNDTYTITLNDLYCSGAYSDPTDITFTVTVGDSEPAVYYAGPEVHYYGLEIGPNCNFFTDKSFVVKKSWIDEHKNGEYKPDKILISGNVKYYDYENEGIEETSYSCEVAESNDWTCRTTVRVPRNWSFQDQQENIYGSIIERFDPANSNIDDNSYYYVCGQTENVDDRLSDGKCSTNIYGSNIITPEPDGYGIEVTNTLKREEEPDIYTLVKVWNDNDNAEGLRPDSISGSVKATSEADNFTFELTSANDWSDTVSVSKDASLSSCKEEEIAYYQMDSCVIDSVNKTITVTNSIKDKYTIEKVWVDDNNVNLQRPDDITVTLSGDVTDMSISVSENNNWKEVVYIDKTENNLTCDEYSVYNYVKNDCVVDTENKTITVTNTIKDKYTVKKIWNDDNNVNRQRPSGYINVYVEGTGINGTDTGTFYSSGMQEEFGTVYITPGATNLKCYDSVTNYHMDSCVIDTENKTITITNTLNTIYTIKKIWNDNNNEKGLRPSNVYFSYYPSRGSSGSVTLSGNSWETKIYMNPVSDAEDVTISCSENMSNSTYYYMESCVVDRENKTITVTNRLKDEYVIKKVWNDNENERNQRPTNSIYTYLNINGSSYGAYHLYNSNNWETKVYFNPDLIQDETNVSCTEGTINNYRFDGCVVDKENKTITLTNTIYDYYTVEKVWKDDDNRDNVRPTSSGSVTLRSSNGKLSRNSISLTKSNNWTYGIYVHPDSFKDDSTLTCTETAVNGYSFEGCELDTENKTIKVINSRVPLKTSVKVTKNWEGVDEEDIPEKLEVNLYADGVKVESYDLTADEEWTHTFEVNKNNNGVPIVYTVTETMIDGYYVNITGNANSGFELSNVKTEETKKVKITTNVICGEGTVTGDEELIYGSNSTPYLIVATGAKGYAVDYIMFNDEKRTLEDLTNKYSFSGFYNVIEDKDIKVCFVERPELLGEELDGGEEDPVPPEPEEPGKTSSESNQDTPTNPNTLDMIYIVIIGAILSAVVFVNFKKKIF